MDFEAVIIRVINSNVDKGVNELLAVISMSYWYRWSQQVTWGKKLLASLTDYNCWGCVYKPADGMVSGLTWSQLYRN